MLDLADEAPDVLFLTIILRRVTPIVVFPKAVRRPEQPGKGLYSPGCSPVRTVYHH
jgi:hypothetical protein